MRVLWKAALAAVFAAAASPALAAPPLSAYGALPSLEQVTLSQDGSQLAYITVIGEHRTLVAQTLDGKALGMVDVGDAKVRDLQWAGDEDLIILKTVATHSDYSWGKGEWGFAISYNLKKKRFLQLGDNIKNTLNTVAGAPALRFVDGKWVAVIGTFSLVDHGLVLRQASLQNLSTERLDELKPNAESWLLDDKGRVQAQARYDEYDREWSLEVRRGAGWPTLYKVKADLDTPNLVGFSRDGKSPVIAFVDDKNGDRFLEISNTGEQRPALPDDHPYRDVLVDPLTERLIGGVYFDRYTHYAFFDPKDQAVWDKVGKAFKGQRVQLVSWSDDRDKVVVMVEGAHDAGSYYLADFTTRKVDLIGEAYPDVKAQDVAEIRPYAYKAADGMDIPAFLTLPPGKAAKDLPLVVLAHGGPAAHDTLGFDWWGQALASRGYAVLQANYRGSTGYGAAHLEAGYGQWGRKMQTDLSDGVRALAADGVIDPKRVCIVGASYGGYAAMAGPTLDLGVYRCAVAVAGVSDLRLMLGGERIDADSEESMTTRYWRRFMGAKADNDPAIDAYSPARLADRLDAPILLIHGKDDTVVPYNQSVVFQTAARKAGKQVELVTLKGEDHWLSRNATRLQMLQATVAFVEKHNPAD